MRWTAIFSLVGSYLKASSGCVAALFLAMSMGAAYAGPITDVTPAPANTEQTLDPDVIRPGPSIEPNATAESPNDASADDSEQAYVPWIVPDRESLEWFGKHDDVLPVDANPAIQPLTESEPVASGTDEPAQTYWSQMRTAFADQNLDTTLTKLVAGFFQGLSYVKTIFVIGPIIALAAVIGLIQLSRILRVSQGLDPDKGKPWSTERPHRRRRDEGNDNVKAHRTNDAA